MTHNPFDPSQSAPQRSTNYFADKPALGVQLQNHRGLIGHVPIVGGLLIAQAILELMMFVFAVGFGILFANIPAGPNSPKMPLGQAMFGFAILGTFSLVGLIAHLTAGIAMILFSHRRLAFVMVCVGFAAVMTVYCAPTALVLAIYAMIVLINEPVIWAFDQVAAGIPREQAMLGPTLPTQTQL